MNTGSMPLNRWATAGCIALLAVVALGLFAHGVEIRRPWFGTTGDPLDAWFMSAPLTWVKNWYREGPLHLRFGICTNPRSIEFPTLADRALGQSYPPGSLIPGYLLGVLLRREPSLEMIMAYAMFNQLVCAFSLSCLVFAAARQAGRSRIYALILAHVPLIVYSLLPGTLYHHMMRFWADHIVVMYYVIFVLLEVLRDSTSNRRTRAWIAAIQAGVGFLGLFTDWLFVYISLCVYAKRWARGELGRGLGGFLKGSFLYWLPFGIAMGLFGLQLLLLIGVNVFWAHVTMWTTAAGKSKMPLGPPIFFWAMHMNYAYGAIGIFLTLLGPMILAAGLLHTGIRRLLGKRANLEANRLVGTLVLLVVPSWAHFLSLPRHSAFIGHSFTALKFAIPLATVPLALGPLLILAWYQGNAASLAGRRAGLLGFPALPLLLVGLAAGYTALESSRLEFLYTKGGGQNDSAIRAAELVGKQVAYEDVVFCLEPDLAIDSLSATLPTAMKFVHRAAFVRSMLTDLENVQGDYSVALIRRLEAPVEQSDFARLLELPHERVEQDGFVYERFKRQDFLNLCQQLGVERDRRKSRTPPASTLPFMPLPPSVSDIVAPPVL